MDEKQVNQTGIYEKAEKRARKPIVNILIPILIIIVVFGIWAFKNAGSNDDDGNLDLNGNPDTSGFALDATENFNLEEILSHGLPVMIDFGADACDPCKEMAPLLKELNMEYRGKAVIKFVDVWRNQSAAEGFPLRVIPTQFFFDKDGNTYAYHEGGMDKASIIEVLEELGVE
ncbi:MAG: thioredoxin family protein [Bacillota bacterium]|nr:thioredoxin family protein [Bacillota bacterium]